VGSEENTIMEVCTVFMRQETGVDHSVEVSRGHKKLFHPRKTQKARKVFS
jgi:hypothetical protein